MSKTNSGRFFEDYSMGMVIQHAVPRTIGDGERALYHALYPARINGPFVFGLHSGQDPL